MGQVTNSPRLFVSKENDGECQMIRHCLLGVFHQFKNSPVPPPRSPQAPSGPMPQSGPVAQYLEWQRTQQTARIRGSRGGGGENALNISCPTCISDVMKMILLLTVYNKTVHRVLILTRKIILEFFFTYFSWRIVNFWNILFIPYSPENFWTSFAFVYEPSSTERRLPTGN